MKELIDSFVKAITPDWSKGPIANLIIDKKAEVEFEDGVWKYKIKKPMKEEIKDLCKSWDDQELDIFLATCLRNTKWISSNGEWIKEKDVVDLIKEKQERSPSCYSQEEE